MLAAMYSLMQMVLPMCLNLLHNGPAPVENMAVVIIVALRFLLWLAGEANVGEDSG